MSEPFALALVAGRDGRCAWRRALSQTSLVANTFDDYGAFYAAVVRPSVDQGYYRLDGQSFGADNSLSLAGRFKYQGVLWDVHADSRIVPLVAAYAAYSLGIEPFVVHTPTRGRKSLRLRPELRGVRDQGRGAGGLYLYALQ